jgi:hypothetical protein
MVASSFGYGARKGPEVCAGLAHQADLTSFLTVSSQPTYSQLLEDPDDSVYYNDRLFLGVSELQ